MEEKKGILIQRETKKEKKEGDTCRDCWTKRFRNDLIRQYKKERDSNSTFGLSDFFNRELQAREDAVKLMRDEFQDIYDEISAIEHLAGDVFMGRFDQEKGD